MNDWSEDTDYEHPTLDWLFRYVPITSKSKKSRTVHMKKICRLDDFYRLVDLAKMEHSDCEPSCEVREVLAAIGEDS